MSRIVLVRHGETVWHAENRYAGSSDIELSDHGREQAQALSQWAANAGLERLYVSPLLRARETARPSEAVLCMQGIVDSRLREIAFGEGEGLTSREMSKRFPAEYAAFRRDPVKHHLPGGEDPMAAIARGRAALQEIASQAGPRARVLVVTHNTLIRLLLCDLLGIPPARYRQVFPEVGNVSINELELTERGAALLRFNVPIL
jgi:broad specificity phosphatase PhoE